jgi:FkbM family methyltransferase
MRIPALGLLSRRARKISLVARCELALSSKLRYLFDAAVGSFLPGTMTLRQAYRMQDDTSVVLRGNSTDMKVFEEIFLERIYSSYAKAVGQNAPAILIDLGANIGLSVIALASALRPLAVVAVEPDGGNFAMLKENLRLAKLPDRCVTVQAFAGVERGFAQLVDSGNGEWGMRMGAPAPGGIAVWPIEDIVATAERIAGQVDLERSRAAITVVKCDIEGGEAPLFRRLREWEDRVHYVILELHTEFLSVRDFHACLSSSRYHWQIDGTIPADAVLAVIGLKRLRQKAAAQSRHAARS